MNRMRHVLVAWISLLLTFPLFAAEPRQQPTDQERARTVYIFHQPIVMLQATFGLSTPEERVLRIRNTLRAFTREDVSKPLTIEPITRYNQPARLFLMNGKPIMLLSQADLDEGDDLTLDQAAQRVLARMELQRTALRDQYNSGYLALAVVKSLLGAGVLALFCYGAYRAWRWVRRYNRRMLLEKRGIIPHSWRRFLGAIESKLFGLLMILLSLAAAYLWIGWMFSLFPWTRVWGESLGATRRLISVMVWLFALSAAYPFLPGANSLAFKGISVFFGLMLTLGSAGLMNHAMSGLVLIYSRALRKGDVIRIADNEGLVSEIGMLATKIITRENYVVTVPNAVVVSGKITNLSAQNPGGGVNLTTSVTIGYDSPWRQVHAMLELAARRADGIDHSQPPIVRQLSLMDWYISYELQVQLLPGTSLAMGRNALHSHIQDVFNEFNVQIMSPNFVLQPEGAVMVAKENWYAAPATLPQRTDA